MSDIFTGSWITRIWIVKTTITSPPSDLLGSMGCSIVEQFLSVEALLGNIEDVYVVLSQSHLFHPVRWSDPVQLGEEKPHGRVEGVSL